MINSSRMQLILALLFIVALAAFVVYAMIPYIPAVFGALILYVIFRPLHDYLVKKLAVSNKLASLTVVLAALLVVFVPLMILATLLIQEIPTLVQSVDSVREMFDTQGFEQLLESLPDQFAESAKEAPSQIVEQVAGFIRISIVSTITNAFTFFLNVIILGFLLYFMLQSGDAFNKGLRNAIPFKNANKDKLLKEWHSVTYSTIISTGIIALIQGMMMSIAFIVLGVPGPLFWGFISAMLSFLPIVGPPIIWGPLAIYFLITGQIFSAIGLLIWGLILSNLDNFLRPIINERIGKIHPLTTFLGVIIGIPYFGIIGIIIGPLLLSYLFLTWKMFTEEYLSK